MTNLTPTQIDAKHCVEALKEDDAVRVVGYGMDGESVPIFGDDELTRGWVFSTADDLQDHKEFLRLFTSAKNYPKNQLKYVDDPLIDKKVYKGRYRQAIVKTRKVKDTELWVIEVLRKGWAQSIMWDEARVAGGGTLKSNERQIVIHWLNIDPSKLNMCLTSLIGTQITNPTIQGDQYTGLWAFANIKPSQAADGSGILEAELTRIVNVTTVADLTSAMQHREKIHDVDHPFGIGGKFNVNRTGKQYQDGIMLTYNFLSPTSRTVLEKTITDLQLLGLLDTGEGTGAPPFRESLYELKTRDVKEDEATNTLILYVVFKRVGKIAWSHAVMPSPDLIDYENKDTRNEIQVHYWFGIQHSDEATVRNDLETDISGYVMLRYSLKDNDDGSFNVVQEIQFAETWSGEPEPDKTTSVKSYKLTATTNYYQNIEHKWTGYKVTSGLLETVRLALENRYHSDTQYVGCNPNDRGNGIFDVEVRVWDVDSSSGGKHDTAISSDILYVWTDKCMSKAGNVYVMYSLYKKQIKWHSTYDSAWKYLMYYAPPATMRGPNTVTPFGVSDVRPSGNGYDSIWIRAVTKGSLTPEEYDLVTSNLNPAWPAGKVGLNSGWIKDTTQPDPV